MPSRETPCIGEYWWRQPDPVPVAAMALLNLPGRISIAVSHGADTRRQSLSLALRRSTTGLDHLVLQPLEHRGNHPAIDTTRDLFTLLMNTLATLLHRHCAPGVSLGGAVPICLDNEHDTVELPWQQFGFQLLGEATPGKRRVLARVRNLHQRTPISAGCWPPLQLPWNEVEWQPSRPIASSPGAPFQPQ